MRIAMLVAVSAAGLTWCMSASAQQSGAAPAATEAGADRTVKEVDLIQPATGARPLAPTPEPAAVRRVWLITPDDKTLQATLSAWSATAGWQLQWDLPVDYPIEIRAAISGTFGEAVETITNAMEKADVPMKAIFYMGNKVLRMTAKGGE